MWPETPEETDSEEDHWHSWRQTGVELEYINTKISNTMQQKLTVDKWIKGHHGDVRHAHIPSSSSCEKNMWKI